MDANQLTNPDDIAAGQFLVIPRREDIVAEVAAADRARPDRAADADRRRRDDRRRRRPPLHADGAPDSGEPGP